MSYVVRADGEAVFSTGTPTYEGETVEDFNLTRVNDFTLASSEIRFGSAPLTIHAAVPLEAPVNVTTASAGANRVTVRWDAVENAVGYTVSWSMDQENWTDVAAAENSCMVTGLVCGATTYYRVKALGNGMQYADSAYSAAVGKIVCPVDIDSDGRIGPSDMSCLSKAWFTRPASGRWDLRCDIDGNGTVGPSDMTYLSVSWLKKSSAVTVYPAAAADLAAGRNDAVDAVFDAALEEVFASPWEDGMEDFA